MKPRFSIRQTPLTGLVAVERQRRGDERGYLERLFCSEELFEAGWQQPIRQVNHTYTHKCGTVRGLHFQHPPRAESKLVICIKGAVFDVAVDLRRSSPTYLQWHAVRISESNGLAMMIPEGFGHGFQTLTEEVEMIYCHSSPYCAEAEGGVHPKDPELDITWPLEIAELSERDDNFPFLKEDFKGIDL